jgi:hypothetical protein
MRGIRLNKYMAILLYRFHKKKKLENFRILIRNPILTKNKLPFKLIGKINSRKSVCFETLNLFKEDRNEFGCLESGTAQLKRIFLKYNKYNLNITHVLTMMSVIVNKYYCLSWSDAVSVTALLKRLIQIHI